MGFGGFGGVRREHVVYYMAREKGDQGQTWIGELDGSHSSRLKRIAQAFEGTGLPVTIERNIDAWLKTHVALISPIAYAIYAADGDNYRLARTRDGLVLLVRAVREGFQVLRALSIPITPAWFKIFEWIPEPLLVTWVRRIMDTQAAEIAMAGHANVARDEMQHLAEEFRTLVRATSVLTPAMDRLHTYFNPDEPSLAEGSAQLPMNWRGVWIGLGLLAGLSLALGVLLRFGKR
jgi:2-dehydropantoate 2-reductase